MRHLALMWWGAKQLRTDAQDALSVVTLLFKCQPTTRASMAALWSSRASSAPIPRVDDHLGPCVPRRWASELTEGGARALLVSHWEVGSDAAVKLTTRIPPSGRYSWWWARAPRRDSPARIGEGGPSVCLCR